MKKLQIQGENSTKWEQFQENTSKSNNLTLKLKYKYQNSWKELKGLEVMSSSFFQSDVKNKPV